MTEVLRLSLSIARSGWRANWNRMYRFSRAKAGLIWLIVQTLFVMLVARRTPSVGADGAEGGLLGAAALMALQMGWFGLMTGFSRGQMQLYQGLLVPLFQLSPARPLAFLLGRVIEAVPQRAWNSLLWAWAYSAVVPGPGRWVALALLWATGAGVGMLAHLAGLLLLALWGRLHPRTMRSGNLFFGIATMAMVTWAVVFVAQGGTVTELSLALREYRRTVLGAVLTLGGLPGLALALGLLVRPQWVEDLYRNGLYRVVELGEQDSDRPGRSFWLPIASDGVLRAVLSREWLHLVRSKAARVQLAMFGAGVVGVFLSGREMKGQPMQLLVLYVGLISLLSWFMAFGHLVVRVFEQERVTVALYRLAAVPAPKLVAAKLASVAVPSGVLVAIAATVGSLAARLSPAGALGVLFWSELALLAGVAGGFGVAAATADQELEEPDAGAAPRNELAAPTNLQSNAWFALARTLAVLVCTALPIWAGAGSPGMSGAPAVALGLALGLPAVLLAGGVWWMLRMWRT